MIVQLVKLQKFYQNRISYCPSQFMLSVIAPSQMFWYT